MNTRECHRCKTFFPLTAQYFLNDKSRPAGLSYECRSCHNTRKRGAKDSRKDRWKNMTDAQKEKRKAVMLKYGRTNKGRAVLLRGAYKRVDACDMSSDEVAAMISLPCVYCGTEDLPRGLDRIDNKLPHIRGNVRPACAPCNFARGDRFTAEEMDRIGAVIKSIWQDRKTKVIENAGHL